MAKDPETIQFIKVGDVEHPIDAKTVGGKTLPDESLYLPTVSNSDNGKILRVQNGQWSLFSPESLYQDINGVECGDGPGYEKQYLTLEVLTSGTIGWYSKGTGSEKTVQYSINDGEWTSITAGSDTTISATQGDIIRFKGSNTAYATSNTVYSGFGLSTATATYNVYGNIMSFIYGDNFIDHNTLSTQYTFCCLFDGSNVVSAENLILPAMSLTGHCYRSLFGNCTLLTTPPVLPATSLEDNCYRYLFGGCTSLTTAPELPATTLASDCYYYMFQGCTHLTTAPELPATTLVSNCYRSMFTGCSILNYIKCLATNISASGCLTDWVKNVAGSGTFVKEVGMTGWTIDSTSGIPIGWTVQDAVIDTGDSDSDSDSDSDIPVHDYSQDYLTFVMLENNSTVTSYEDNVYISSDGGQTWTSSEISNLMIGDEVLIKGTYSSITTNGPVSCDKSFNVKGNILSLYDPINFRTRTSLNNSSDNFGYIFRQENVVSAENLVLPLTTLTENCYAGMFADCTSLTTPPSLPATTLSDYCYYDMFELCTSLTTPPSLPATTLSDNCYTHMFHGCSSLTTVPSLTATTLADNCYSYMFYGCTNLTTVPALPATTLADNCYEYMFEGCTSLTTAPVLPATTLASYCYQFMFYDCTSLTTTPALPATTLAEGCYDGMFSGCTSLTTAPVLPATTLAEGCYDGMFSGCTSLTTAPVLPATTLVEYCYGWMFSGCSSLNYIKCLATNISAIGCTSDWVDGVAATGTFIKNPDMTSWTIDSTSGIPVGWTVIENSTDTGDSDSENEYGDSDSDTGDSDSESEVPVHDYSLDYLTFNVLTGGNILWKSIGSGQAKTISYSINDGEWTSITATSAGTAIPVSAGDVVRFKGTNSSYAADKSNYSGFDGGTATYDVEGNMMSLIYGDNFVGNNTLTGTYNFCSIFKQSKAISAENMILPATTLTNYCYRAMFSLAPNLSVAPALPATTLATGCYWYMFESCPITTAPDLLAETIVAEAYGHMFTGCGSLNYIKCLATTKSASKCLEGWVTSVAATGTFVKDANTSWSTGNNGIPTGWVVFDGEVVDSPVISFNGEDTITITCATTGATIYYRLGSSGNFTTYSGPITISADTTVYTYAEKDGGQSQTVSQKCEYSEHTYKFGDLQFASGPLYYGSNGYEIKDSWNYSSYGTVYGKSVGSTFFSYIEMGDLFKKSGFTTSDGSILNTLDPLDGWRLPTKEEWDYMTGITRTGSSVNGVSGKHYAFINFDHDGDGNTANIYGVLLFPDGETITGASLSNLDNTTTNENLTVAQVNNYLSQGCIFLPAEGYCQSGSFDGNNTYIGYWSSIEGLTNSDAYIVTKSSTLGTDTYSKTSYLPVYLVRDTTYGEETPLEGATKSLNTWTI